MTSSSLAAITSLKKLVNHPDLIFEHCRDKKEGFENAAKYVTGVDCLRCSTNDLFPPPGIIQKATTRREGCSPAFPESWPC